MLLLNICAVARDKKTIQIGLCFLSGEKKPNYTWAIAAFQEMMEKHGILPLATFVTERELVLINTLDDLFLESLHILCIWHMNMNILANCRKHFPKDKPNLNPANRGDIANKRKQQANLSNSDFILDPEWAAFLKD